MKIIKKKSILFSKDYEEVLKKAYGINYDAQRFARTCILFSLLISCAVSGLIAAILLFNNKPVYYAGFVLILVYILTFQFIKLIPTLNIRKKKAVLESDLLYSARHLLLKLESGSSLINSLESVSKLKTKSALYFKQIVFDISFGMPLEDALKKAVEYSPSKAYSKLLEEIKTSLATGADMQQTLKGTLADVTRRHLINIQEYGKKLNPLSMFYMIIGTMLPSLGTAMIIVASSLLPGVVVIDMRVLMFIAFFVFVLQMFFLLGFRSLKPEVME
ncbi:MAG: type II secretion system F family protein [archaeon]